MERKLKEKRQDAKWAKESQSSEPGNSVNEHRMMEEGNRFLAKKELGQIQENQ